MTELDSLLEGSNPVPQSGPGSEVAVPSFEAVWSAAQAGSRPRPRVFALASASATVAAIAAVVVVLVSSGSAPSSAFAAWSATPTKPRHGEILSAERQCHQSRPASLADTRGPFALLLFEMGSRRLVLCHAWPSGFAGVAAAQPMGKTPSGDALTIVDCNSGGYQTTSSHGTYMQMYGLLGRNISRVSISRRGRKPVQATTSDGLWAAWWPGSGRNISIRITTSSGTSIARHFTGNNC